MNDEHDTVIEAILSSQDHYRVLNVQETDNTTTIRRAYLKRSVQVHPDKNQSPQATEAFQRVAAAWQVLSDDSRRLEYDNSRKSRPFGATFGGREEEQSHFETQPSPSFQDALFMFATVTNMMGGGHQKMNAASSMAQTLYWAEKVLQDQTQNSSRGGIDQPLSPADDMSQKANVAMAFGSGLRVLGATAATMGFAKSAAQIQRTADAAQMAGVVGLVAKDNPTVQKLVQEGSRSLQSGRALENFQKLQGVVQALQGMTKGSTMSKNS